jgi:hypothetical protein
MKNFLILLPFFLLITSCATPTNNPDLFSSVQSSRATSDAAAQQAYYQSQFLTATAGAPIVHITETAAGMIYQQQMWTATAQSVQSTGTAAAQSVQSTETAAMTQTAMAWTPTPNATMTAVFVMAAAEATQIANNAERDRLELQRQQDINDFKGKLPAYSFVIVVLVLAIALTFISRRERYRPIPVDGRGNPLPMLDVVEGTATDVDRNPNYRSDLRENMFKQWLRRKLDLPPLLPEITAKRQDETTQRDQLLDLGTRGLLQTAQNAAAKRQAGQEMMKQVSESNLQSRFQILDEEKAHMNVIRGEVIEVLDQDWEQAKQKRGEV